MKTPLQNTSVAEKSIISVIAIVAFFLAAWVGGWYALSTVTQIVVLCVVPGVIYIPVRLLVGGTPLPTRSPISVQIGNSNSRFNFLLAALFMALLQGYITLLFALFVFGCIVTPLGLLESLLSIKLIPIWVREMFWPIIGAAFVAGVAWAAIRDVKEEREPL